MSGLGIGLHFRKLPTTPSTATSDVPCSTWIDVPPQTGFLGTASTSIEAGDGDPRGGRFGGGGGNDDCLRSSFEWQICLLDSFWIELYDILKSNHSMFVSIEVKLGASRALKFKLLPVTVS